MALMLLESKFFPNNQWVTNATKETFHQSFFTQILHRVTPRIQLSLQIPFASILNDHKVPT